MVPPGVDLDSSFTIPALMHSTPVRGCTVGEGLGDGDLLLDFDGLGDGVLLLDFEGLGDGVDDALELTVTVGDVAGLVVASVGLGVVVSVADGLGVSLALMISDGLALALAEGLAARAANSVAFTAAEVCDPDPQGELADAAGPASAAVAACAAGAAGTAGVVVAVVAAMAGAAVIAPIRKPAPTTAAASLPARTNPLGNAVPRRCEPASAGPCFLARSLVTPGV